VALSPVAWLGSVSATLFQDIIIYYYILCYFSYCSYYNAYYVMLYYIVLYYIILYYVMLLLFQAGVDSSFIGWRCLSSATCLMRPNFASCVDCCVKHLMTIFFRSFEEMR